MALDTVDAAEDLDADIADGFVPRERALRAIARFARRHDCTARVVRDHVLVVHSDGGALATRSARRLATWLGY